MIQLAILTGILLLTAGAALLFLRAKILADRRLKQAIAALPAGIGFYDRNDRLYLWNGPYEAVTGGGASRLRRGIAFREILEQDLACGHYAEAIGREQEWLEARLALRAQGEGIREQDLQDGRWLSVADRRTPDGGTVSVCMDVTEIKRREDSFKLMFDNNPVPLWLWEGSRELPILDLNKAALEHLGYTRADLPGLTVFDILSPEERPALKAMLAAGVQRPYHSDRAWRPRRKDGTLLYAVPYIHILPHTQGRPRFVGAIVDVTERVRVEAELRGSRNSLTAALAQAEAANHAKSAFLAAMSHELRTPLNAVIGFSEILKDEMFGAIGNAQYRDYAAHIHSSGAHLLGLINDILDLSKLDAGQLELHETDLDLGALIADCVRSMQLQADKAGVALFAHAGEGTIAIHADERRVRQMLLNLLSNAVKFTHAGGVVQATAFANGQGVCLRVIDTGIGMAKEAIPKALERFGQIDSSLSRKYEGTGLGLPLTKQLAELHGGTLTIESKQDSGTTVTIWLPMRGDCAARSVA